MAAMTIALMGFFGFLIMRVTAPQMTPLFTDLSFEDSAAIVKDLERQGIPYELRNDNAIVLVPKDRVTAIGLDQKRGDQVEVVNLRFADAPANPIAEPSGWLSFLTFTKDDVMYGIELLVMLLLALVVVFVVVRPLVRRMLAADTPVAPEVVLKLGPGEAIDIYVNNRLVARRGRPGRGQARCDHDGNHQGGTQLRTDSE